MESRRQFIKKSLHFAAVAAIPFGFGHSIEISMENNNFEARLIFPERLNSEDYKSMRNQFFNLKQYQEMMSQYLASGQLKREPTIRVHEDKVIIQYEFRNKIDIAAWQDDFYQSGMFDVEKMRDLGFEYAVTHT